MSTKKLSKNKKFAIAAVCLLGLLGLGACSWPKTGDRENQSPPSVEALPQVDTGSLKPGGNNLLKDNFHIASDVANIYRKPSTDSETVTQALHGEPAIIIDRRDSWVKIKLPDQSDYQGWVQESVLRKITTAKILANRKIVSVPKARVRSLPNQNAEVLLVLSLGTIVGSEPSEQNGDFVRVRLVDGTKGYVSSTKLADYVERDPSEVSSDRLLKTASQLIGQPYLWGGMTTAGVDCSGFVHTTFKVHGIRLHRDAVLQYVNDGVSVSEDELQPGDLVFFETYKPGPSHVGIYAGQRQMLQASSKKGVSYASLDDTYFSERFLGAKRILSFEF